jgi:cytosol alanyl aminopeptidase
MRAIGVWLLCLACNRPELPAGPRAPAVTARDAPAAAAGAAPAGAPAAAAGGPIAPAGSGAAVPARGGERAAVVRLPDGVAPVAYDLTLEIDPARASFTGRVAIDIAVAAPTAELWLHAVDLTITRAVLRSGGLDHRVELRSGADPQLRGFALSRPVAGRVTLVIDYTGRAVDLSGELNDVAGAGRKDEQGLFRHRVGTRWYLFSQSESIFARRIVPCFDEPRFKPAWRVTAVVPRDSVALGNAPVASERGLPDGRREVRFAEIQRLASYLLAIAVGPFDLMDAGRLGRGRVPVRFAVAKGETGKFLQAIRTLPEILEAVEDYVDAPLPSAKLDLVAVPEFFGAMENTGLVTFNDELLRDPHTFVMVIAHELAHQWFGNAVTPAWWDHLWVSESFATWLAARTLDVLGARLPAARAYNARARALSADYQIDAAPIVHPIASADEIEAAFSPIAYEKGAAVLAGFERLVGPAAFQAVVRGYVARHAGTAVTSRAFVEALAAASGRAVGDALAANLGHAGTPVVELALRCGAPAAIVATTRGGVGVPVCVRVPGAAGAAGPAGATRACFLAGSRGEHALPAEVGCPPWVVGNDGGRGYYRTVWRGRPPHPPRAELSGEERRAHGDDVAAGLLHGDLAIGDALAEIAALAALREPNAEIAALSIAYDVDRLVADPVRPAWLGWLAAQFPDRLSPAVLARTKNEGSQAVRARLVWLVAPAVAPATLAAARGAVERKLDGSHDWIVVRLAAARDPGPLFEQIVQAAATASPPWRDHLLGSLGAFPGELAPRLVDVLLDPRFPPGEAWGALATMLHRPDAAGAAWQAIHARFASVLGRLAGRRLRGVLAATHGLCEPRARAEVAAAFAPRIAEIDDGRRALDRALAAIDRCIAWRAAAGDLAQALAAAPTRSPGRL